MSTNATDVRTAVERALVAYRALATLGEEVEDEWQYVNDLVAAWTADLTALAAADTRPLDQASLDALDTLAEEAGLVTDPHRAIDWLSTFPQVVRLTLEQRP